MLESLAAEHNHGLLILDELGQVSAKDVSQIFYMLGNERGKQRMCSDASLRKSKRWKLAILSSGEVGIADKVEEAGTKIKAGQLVRCIDIDALVDKQYGIYNSLHGLESGAALSNLLKQNCAKYHGIVAEAFIKQLTSNNNSETLKEAIRRDFDIEANRICDKHDLNDADGQVRRVADIFTLYSLTGIYASKFGIFTHSEEQIRESIDFCFDRWLYDRGGKGAFEEKDIADQLNGFLLQNESRFHNWDFPNGNIPNCLGYMKKEPLGTVYYIIPKLFQKEFCNYYMGISSKTVKKTLLQNEIIEVGSDGKDNKITLPDGTRKRFVKIRLKN